MFPTVEVRWFSQGKIPNQIRNWFRSGDFIPEDQELRTDYYLRIAEGDFLGVKLREGRVEVKQRYQPGMTRQFGDRSSGLVEAWFKWGFGLDEGSEEVFRVKVFLDQWVGVNKERTLRKFQVIEDGRVEETSATDVIQTGCALELAQVHLEGVSDLWWSVGFEAFGETGKRRNALILVAEDVLSSEGAPVLKVEESFSYPRWLISA